MVNKTALAVTLVVSIALISVILIYDNTHHQYTIDFDANGGQPGIQIEYTDSSGQLQSLPKDPTLFSYSFNGWYTQKEGGE